MRCYRIYPKDDAAKEINGKTAERVELAWDSTDVLHLSFVVDGMRYMVHVAAHHGMPMVFKEKPEESS